jgi:MFS family permease
MRGAASLRLFRSGSFRALWIGQLVSIFGDRFTYLALLALVVERAADPANPARELALIPIVSFLPAILFSPVVGALVDSWNTRTTLLVSDALRGVLVLAMIPAADTWGLPAAFALVFLLYLVNTFFLPARSAILPDLVPEDSLVEANSLATLAGVIATILGSWLGGLWVERSGWRFGFALDGATYFVSVLALAFIRPRDLEPRPKPHESAAVAYRALARDVAEGARLSLASKPILGSMLAMALLWIAGGALHVALPTVIQGHGSGVVSGIGGVIAFAAAGMVAGTLLLAAWGRGGSRAWVLAASLAGAGTSVVAFARFPSRGAGALAAFLAGLFVALLLITTESAIQKAARPEARARVFALRDFLARLGVVVSAGIFGWLLERRGLTPGSAVVLAGCLLVLGGAAGAFLGRRRAG